MPRLLMPCVWLVCAGVASGQSPALDASLQPSLTGAADFVYKRAAGVDLRLWVFSPSDLKAAEARPAILLFGGGGWTTQDPAQLSPQARYFATKGMVAVVADYRVRAANNATPYDAVTDAKSAVRWLREHANKLQIVPNLLAVAVRRPADISHSPRQS